MKRKKSWSQKRLIREEELVKKLGMEINNALYYNNIEEYKRLIKLYDQKWVEVYKIKKSKSLQLEMKFEDN